MLGDKPPFLPGTSLPPENPLFALPYLLLIGRGSPPLSRGEPVTEVAWRETYHINCRQKNGANPGSPRLTELIHSGLSGRQRPALPTTFSRIPPGELAELPRSASIAEAWHKDTCTELSLRRQILACSKHTVPFAGDIDNVPALLNFDYRWLI